MDRKKVIEGLNELAKHCENQEQCLFCEHRDICPFEMGCTPEEYELPVV